MDDSKPLTDHKYRIRYRYRQWVGKPDPSGMGVGHVYCNNLPGLMKYAAHLKEVGHKVLAIQENTKESWVEMQFN